MKRIQQITEDPNQTTRVILDDGSFFDLTLKFFPQQRGWFIQRLVYKDFVLNGFRVCNSPNFLRQYRDQLPFGLACRTESLEEPLFQDDFSKGFAGLFILDAEEVEQYERSLSAKV